MYLYHICSPFYRYICIFFALKAPLLGLKWCQSYHYWQLSVTISTLFYTGSDPTLYTGGGDPRRATKMIPPKLIMQVWFYITSSGLEVDPSRHVHYYDCTTAVTVQNQLVLLTVTTPNCFSFSLTSCSVSVDTAEQWLQPNPGDATGNFGRKLARNQPSILSRWWTLWVKFWGAKEARRESWKRKACKCEVTNDVFHFTIKDNRASSASRLQFNEPTETWQLMRARDATGNLAGT